MESTRLLREKVVVMNIGLQHFRESLEAQGIKVVQVEWSPPPSLERDLRDILGKLL